MNNLKLGFDNVYVISLPKRNDRRKRIERIFNGLDYKFIDSVDGYKDIDVQTLIDKLLQVFSYQEIESPNEILWIREKAKFVQWVAGKITDLYSDNKTIKQDIDTKMSISWEDNSNDLIDVSAEEVSTPTEE